MGKWLLGIAVLAFAATAHAQTAPAGYERFQFVDVTITMRDDYFSTIQTDAASSRTVYVGTYQGRFYKTTDGGQTWTESTIIPEQRLLWTSGSTVFFGAIRSAGTNSGAVDLIGSRPSPLTFKNVPSHLSGLPALSTLGQLNGESVISAGVGLSERSPRLAMLIGTRGRAAPAVNRISLLSDRSQRGTAISDIAVDPTDRRRIYAATANGLYASYDGGESWSRSFGGVTAAERTANRIAIRPGEPQLMILGTASGAYTSIDQGDNWTKDENLGGSIYDVKFDDKDPNYLYIASGGGLLRSSDGGNSFVQSFYSTFPSEGDVRSITIDPFDPDTGYISTTRGAFVTRKLRTAVVDDWLPIEALSVLAVPSFAACSKHRGHLYAMTRLDLNTILYGASPPESSMIESWDGGRTWRRLFSGQSDGVAQTFAIDSKDPDQLWIGWTTALHRLERAGTGRARSAVDFVLTDEQHGPTVGEIVLAALRHHGLELVDYSDKLSRRGKWFFIPRAFTVTGTVRQWSAGGVQDDAQFAANRYLQVGSAREWEIMAWASWDLPDRMYSPDSVPMLRQRLQINNDELRRRINETVRRSYGEVQRIRARLAEANLDLKTLITYRLRLEQLEAIVDLTSGGYLTRWQKQHRRDQ